MVHLRVWVWIGHKSLVVFRVKDMRWGKAWTRGSNIGKRISVGVWAYWVRIVCVG